MNTGPRMSSWVGSGFPKMVPCDDQWQRRRRHSAPRTSTPATRWTAVAAALSRAGSTPSVSTVMRRPLARGDLCRGPGRQDQDGVGAAIAEQRPAGLLRAEQPDIHDQAIGRRTRERVGHGRPQQHVPDDGRDPWRGRGLAGHDPAEQPGDDDGHQEQERERPVVVTELVDDPPDDGPDADGVHRPAPGGVSGASPLPPTCSA